jgi:sortase A
MAKAKKKRKPTAHKKQTKIKRKQGFFSRERLTMDKLFLGMIALGVVISLFSAYRQQVYERSLKPPESAVNAVAALDAHADEFGTTPVKLQISGILDLPIEAVPLVAGQWNVSESGANYLLDSARMGDAGNIIVYGHNWPELLGNLGKVAVGQEIVMTDESGQNRTYRVFSTSVEHPDDPRLLQPTETEVLTIYTCTGFMDSKRLVVQAKPVESS